MSNRSTQGESTFQAVEPPPEALSITWPSPLFTGDRLKCPLVGALFPANPSLGRITKWLAHLFGKLPWLQRIEKYATDGIKVPVSDRDEI